MSDPATHLLQFKRPELALRSAAIYLAGRWRRDLAGLSPDERRALCLPLLILLLAFTIGWFIRGSGLVFEGSFYGFLLFALPVYALARALYRWAVEDESLWRVLLRDVRPNLPLAALGPDAKRVAWPILTVSLIAANAGVFACVADPWTYAFASDPRWTSEKRGRFQAVNATIRANASEGVSQPRVCRGRPFSSAACARASSSGRT